MNSGYIGFKAAGTVLAELRGQRQEMCTLLNSNCQQSHGDIATNAASPRR